MAGLPVSVTEDLQSSFRTTHQAMSDDPREPSGRHSPRAEELRLQHRAKCDGIKEICPKINTDSKPLEVDEAGNIIWRVEVDDISKVKVPLHSVYPLPPDADTKALRKTTGLVRKTAFSYGSTLVGNLDSGFIIEKGDKVLWERTMTLIISLSTPRIANNSSQLAATNPMKLDKKTGIFKHSDGKESFFSKYNTRMYAVQNRIGATGSYAVRGPLHDLSDSELSEQDVDHMRHVIGTSRRDQSIVKAFQFVTCGQMGKFSMFTTRHGNKVCLGLADQILKATDGSPAVQFDKLWALTKALCDEAYWMNDNECWGEGGELDAGIKYLGAAWKALLAKSDEELSIDREFTRPAIEVLLENFAELVAKSSAVSVSFQYH